MGTNPSSCMPVCVDMSKVGLPIFGGEISVGVDYPQLLTLMPLIAFMIRVVILCFNFVSAHEVGRNHGCCHEKIGEKSASFKL